MKHFILEKCQRKTSHYSVFLNCIKQTVRVFSIKFQENSFKGEEKKESAELTPIAIFHIILEP